MFEVGGMHKNAQNKGNLSKCISVVYFLDKRKCKYSYYIAKIK